METKIDWIIGGFDQLSWLWSDFCFSPQLGHFSYLQYKSINFDLTNSRVIIDISQEHWSALYKFWLKKSFHPKFLGKRFESNTSKSGSGRTKVIQLSSVMIILSLIPQHIFWRKNQYFNILICLWELDFMHVHLLLFLYSIMWIGNKILFCYFWDCVFFENPFLKKWDVKHRITKLCYFSKGVSVEIQRIHQMCFCLDEMIRNLIEGKHSYLNQIKLILTSDHVSCHASECKRSLNVFPKLLRSG